MFNQVATDYKCPLCDFVQGNESEYNSLSDIVYEDDDVLAFVSPKWWVNNPGNVMVIPKIHAENIYDIEDEILSKVQIVGKKLALAIRETYGCEGTSFRQHNEPAGNQRVWHYHLHVFPRWINDDLYINYENKKYVSIDERKEYADKIRNYLGNS